MNVFLTVLSFHCGSPRQYAHTPFTPTGWRKSDDCVPFPGVANKPLRAAAKAWAPSEPRPFQVLLVLLFCPLRQSFAQIPIDPRTPEVASDTQKDSASGNLMST